jgi:DNA-binding transcriptional LysR family regulator
VNIHHLELFYYVAKHGGIMEAVRKIPYGIQQPAVSAQILQLERTVGTKLFQRRPFALTGQGEKLFTFIKPFFGELPRIADELMGKTARFVRLGASGPVLRHHLPRALRTIREAMPGLTMHLVEGYETHLVQLLKKDEIDLAITSLHDSMPPGLGTAPIISLPLSLIVPKSSRIRTAEDLWKRDSIDEPLIALPADDGVARNFQNGLHKLGVDWPPGLVVSSLELVEIYVAEGFGFGMGVVVPELKPNSRVRQIPLRDFPELRIGSVWVGAASPLVQMLVPAFQRYAQTIGGV